MTGAFCRWICHPAVIFEYSLFVKCEYDVAARNVQEFNAITRRHIDSLRYLAIKMNQIFIGVLVLARKHRGGHSRRV